MESLCWLCRSVGVRSRIVTKGFKLIFPCVVDSYFGIGVLVWWVFCRCIVYNSEEWKTWSALDLRTSVIYIC
jgi:hypothetical protein